MPLPGDGQGIVDSRLGLEDAGTLGLRADARQRRCGLDEDCLDLARCQRGTLLKDQRGRAARDRSGLGGPAAAEEAVAEGGSGKPLVDIGAGDPKALEVGAGGQQVRVAGAAAEAREGGDERTEHRATSGGGGGAHGDDVGVRRGVVKPAAGGAPVAGGGHHHDPGVPGHLGGEGQRVVLIALGAVGAERKVEDPDVDAVVVAVLDDPADRRDDLGDINRAAGRPDLDVDDPRVGRDAEIGGAGVGDVRPGVLARDEAGHEGAVAERIEVLDRGSGGVEGDVRAVDDLAGAGQSLNGRDPGVDDGDVHPGAGDPLAPRRIGADGGGGVRQRVGIRGRVVQGMEGSHRIGGDGQHARERGELGQPCGRNLRREAVDDPQFADDGSADEHGRALELCQRAGLAADDDRTASRGGAGSGGHGRERGRCDGNGEESREHGEEPGPKVVAVEDRGHQCR